jgi:transcriptional regulator with XRE-family HTH domain
MLAETSNQSAAPKPAAVLAKAVTRAAEHLGISQQLLGKILGLSPATVSRMYAGSYQLDSRRKEWDLALLFVRAFRSLDSIVGDSPSARAWLQSDNLALNARPIDLLSDTEGLVSVVHYLDASRAVG